MLMIDKFKIPLDQVRRRIRDHSFVVSKTMDVRARLYEDRIWQ